MPVPRVTAPGEAEALKTARSIWSLTVEDALPLFRWLAVTLSGSGCVAEIDALSVFVPGAPGVTMTVTE